MQITRTLSTGQTKITDTIYQGETVVWTLACQQVVAGALALYNLTGTTGMAGTLTDGLGNAVATLSDVTSPSGVVVTNSPGTDGKITVTLAGATTLPLTAGNYVLAISQKVSAVTNYLGHLTITLKIQTATT